MFQIFFTPNSVKYQVKMRSPFHRCFTWFFHMVFQVRSSSLTIRRAEISWIYPPRFPKMKNNIKIKTYIKCIHRPAYAYDRPHLNPSEPPLLICVHLYASTFVSPHFPSSTFIYLHVPLSAIIILRLPSFPIICPYLPPSALICLYSSSSHLICLHLRSSTVIFLHFPSSALIYHHLH